MITYNLISDIGTGIVLVAFVNVTFLVIDKNQMSVLTHLPSIELIMRV